MKRSFKLLLLLTLVLSLIAFTGCGGSDEDEGDTDAEEDGGTDGDNVQKPDIDCSGVNLDSPDVMDCMYAKCSELATWDDIDDTRKYCLVEVFFPCMEECVDTGDSPREGEMFALDCVSSEEFIDCIMGE